jgi:hemerythrin
MDEIEWKDKYLLGNNLIDNQHLAFADLINKFIRAHKSGKENNYLDRLIMEIQKYGEFHFVSEENYMMERNYPGLEEHKIQHVKLIEQFSLAVNYIELGTKNYDSFICFIVDWFKGHTVTQDKQIVDYYMKVHLD